MSQSVNARYAIRSLSAVLFSVVLLCYSTTVNGFTLNASNVQEMAIYKVTPTIERYLEPSKIVFNVTATSVISNLISSLEFSVERDCSDVGSLAVGIIYLKFKDTNIELYELLGEWSHISKIGLRGSCYSITEQGRTLFESNAQ